MTSTAFYRQVPVGETSPNAVTVGIEADSTGTLKVAVWWEAKGDVDADEAEYDDVGLALAAAEAARVLHGFDEVVVILAEPVVWQAEWGTLQQGLRANEPMGDIRDLALSEGEAEALAAGLDAESDA